MCCIKSYSSVTKIKIAILVCWGFNVMDWFVPREDAVRRRPGVLPVLADTGRRTASCSRTFAARPVADRNTSSNDFKVRCVPGPSVSALQATCTKFSPVRRSWCAVRPVCSVGNESRSLSQPANRQNWEIKASVNSPPQRKLTSAVTYQILYQFSRIP